MPVARDGPRAQTARDHLFVFCFTVRTTVGGRVASQLSPPVGAPTIGDAVGREPAGVEPAGADRREAESTSDRCRHPLHASIAVAQLAEAAVSPAVSGTCCRYRAGVPAACGDDRELERILSECCGGETNEEAYRDTSAHKPSWGAQEWTRTGSVSREERACHPAFDARHGGQNAPSCVFLMLRHAERTVIVWTGSTW